MCKSVYVGGTFDLFHRGHADLLEFAVRLASGGPVYAVVNSDEFNKETGKVTAQSTEERVEAVKWFFEAEDIRNFQVIVLNTKNDQLGLLNKIKPNYMLHGNDWDYEKLKERYGFDDFWLYTRRIELIYKDRTPGISSTMLRDKIK
jgi:phosphoenolpyruvate phosphomutase